jgi:hypothetical protein
MSQFEQRPDIKFCQKLGKSPSETFNKMKQVYGEEALGRSAVFKWHQRFAQGTVWSIMGVVVGQKRSELNAMFSAAIPMLTDLHSANGDYFEGRCGSVYVNDL